jgi:uncharacterized protein (TIGR03083 family)
MGNAIEALQADREALLDICAGLGDAEWKADSGCPGWSVQDVVAHLGALFWMLVDPSTLPAAGDRPTEQAQEVYVRARRDWSAQQVVEDYRTVSSDAIGQLTELQTQDFELPLGDLGTYPASLLPNAYAFDHFTHIRADLFLPRGPLSTTPPASDELRLVPAIEWVAAALPQQNALVREALDGVRTGGRARRAGHNPRGACWSRRVGARCRCVRRRPPPTGGPPGSAQHHLRTPAFSEASRDDTAACRSGLHPARRRHGQ